MSEKLGIEVNLNSFDSPEKVTKRVRQAINKGPILKDFQSLEKLKPTAGGLAEDEEK